MQSKPLSPQILTAGLACLALMLACSLVSSPAADEPSAPPPSQAQPDASTTDPIATPEPEEVSESPLEVDSEILFQDDFSSNTNGWIEDMRSDQYGELTREVADGKYRMSLTAKQDYFWAITSIPDFRGKDFKFSIDVTILDTNVTPGNLFLQFSLREADGVNGKHYAFEFHNDGTFFGEVWSSSSWESALEILDPRSSSAIQLEPGTTNTFTIEAVGNLFTLYINNEELASTTDATINEAGTISINLGLDDADQSVILEFDNLTIQGNPSPPGTVDDSSDAQPTTPPEAQSSCYKWDQITLDMAGEEVCVYGVAFSHQGKSRIDFSPEKNSFFLIDATYYYPNLAEGVCVVAEEEVEVFDSKIPFMTINGDLYKCEPWMME